MNPHLSLSKPAPQTRWFRDGCSFLLPYFAVFLLAWIFNRTVTETAWIFLGLHVFFLTLILGRLVWAFRKGFPWELLFWAGLAIAFFLAGACLAYPSDAWEHIRRIYRWDHPLTLRAVVPAYDFASFWAWSLLSWVGPGERKIAFDIYGAFWQLLLAYQGSLLLSGLGLGRPIAMGAMAAVFLAMGLFDYRILALGAAPLLYVVGLRVIASFMDVLKGRWTRLAYVFACLPILYLSPPWQEKLAIRISVPDKGEGLRELDALADWIKTERSYNPSCTLVSDGITATFLTSHLGRHGGEIAPSETPEDIRRLIAGSHVCAVVVSTREAGISFERSAGTLLDMGWRRTQIPPFHYLYEPPVSVHWTMIDINAGEAQGDAHLLRMPNGAYFLVDAGDNGGRLHPFLLANDVKVIDRVIISHPHRDHYEGLRALAGKVRINELFLNPPDPAMCLAEPWGCDGGVFRDTIRKLERAGTVVRPIRPGDVLYEGNGTKLEVLYAFDGIHTPVGRTDINDTSNILRLTVGRSRALFTGDLNDRLGTYLAREGTGIEAHILKVPHHGTEGVAPDAFFDRVNPRLALVPAPKHLWESDRSRRIRDYFASRPEIELRVNGIHGSVSVVIETDRITVDGKALETEDSYRHAGR